MRNVTEALKFLGSRQKDVVTGLAGVVTSICFDVNGCVEVDPITVRDFAVLIERRLQASLEQNGERAMPAFPYDLDRKHVAGPAEKPAK